MIQLQSPRDENGRPLVRSLADALELLRDYKIAEDAAIEIRAMPLRFDRSVVTFLALVVDSPSGPELCLHLPPASHFKAISSEGAAHVWDASLLCGASTCLDGRVRFEDGSVVRVTEFVCTRFPPAFDDGSAWARGPMSAVGCCADAISVSDPSGHYLGGITLASRGDSVQFVGL